MTMDLYKALKAVGVDDALATQAARSISEELATKSDIAELRAATKTDIAELRTELKTEMAELRAEVKTDIAELRSEIIAAEERGSRRLMKANIISATLIIAANAAVISLL